MEWLQSNICAEHRTGWLKIIYRETALRHHQVPSAKTAHGEKKKTTEWLRRPLDCTKQKMNAGGRGKCGYAYRSREIKTGSTP